MRRPVASTLVFWSVAVSAADQEEPTTYHLKRFRGTPSEIGRAIGRELGEAFIDSLDQLLTAMDPHGEGRADDAGLASLRRDATTWLTKLPRRYQNEFTGMAEVLDCPVEDLLLTYVAGDSSDACTSLVAVVDGLSWVGRNNDFISAGERLGHRLLGHRRAERPGFWFAGDRTPAASQATWDFVPFPWPV